MGAIVALFAVAISTLLVYPLAHVAPVVSLSVVYLPAVLIVSVVWGGWLGVATAVLSAAAFNFFHLPPVGQFTVRQSENWVALAAFLVVAMLASSVAAVTRARTRDAVERRQEADLAAEMARLLLRADDLVEALPTAAARIAQTLGLSSARSRWIRSTVTIGASPFPCAKGRSGSARCSSAPAPRRRTCGGCRSASCRRSRRC